MKEELYIIGAGSVGGHFARNVEAYDSSVQIAGFFDDDESKIGTLQFGFEVLGPVENALRLNNANLLIGIAFPNVKKKIVGHLSQNPSLKYPSFVHPKAWVSSGVEIGQGCIIYPGNSINYGCVIRDFVVMNMNCALGHHTTVGRYSSFAPGVNTGGHTVIEDTVDMGIAAATIQNVKIGRNSVIGGQSMVIDSVPEGVTVAGVPAKVLMNL